MVAYPDPASAFNDALTDAIRLMEQRQMEDALERLDGLSPVEQGRIEVLVVRCEIFLAQENWPRAALFGAVLAKVDPRNPAHWVHWAYATRRDVSLAEAERILREAHGLHPTNATIAFNLACYCAQSQRLEESLAWLRRAIAQEPRYAAAARNDPDLAPLRTSLPSGHAIWNVG
ncbi:MAG: hypothetical protein JWM35_349 [Verrucomicrobia bacterium]|nr:hypothetical protein [Verrucomicrobiota bacterium]